MRSFPLKVMLWKHPTLVVSPLGDPSLAVSLKVISRSTATCNSADEVGLEANNSEIQSVL